MNEVNRKKTKDTGIIVRAGNHEWVVGQSSNLGAAETVEKIVSLSVLEENREAATRQLRSQKIVQIADRTKLRTGSFKMTTILQFLYNIYLRAGRRIVLSLRQITNRSSIKESFQGGLIFGLVLGCASLMLFHQLNDSNSRNMSFRKPADMISEGMLTRAIRAPGLHAYGLSVGKFKTAREAKWAQDQLSAKGIQTIMVQLDGYVLIYQIALQPEDLHARVQEFGKQHVQASILPIQIPSQEYPALPQASAANVSTTSTWLSGEVSALVAICGWATDGGRQSDGIRAFQNADHVYPTDTVLSSTGLSVPLGQFREAVRVAYAACARGDKQQAEAAVLQGYRILLNWQGFDIQS